MTPTDYILLGLIGLLFWYMHSNQKKQMREIYLRTRTPEEKERDELESYASFFSIYT